MRNIMRTRQDKATPGAKTMASKAKGVLVFPNIVRPGLIIGGQYGVGALREKGRTVEYYRSFGATYDTGERSQ